jgi:hypothetical protein
MIFSNNRRCIFDKEDYEILSRWHWVITNSNHIYGWVNGGRKPIANYILEQHGTTIPAGLLVDHINRNPLDNRKCNFRICTLVQNMMNKSPYKCTLSGYRGVTLNRQKQKWRANIRVNGKLIYLGDYECIDDAVEARKKAEDKYFGEFAPKL